MLYRKPWTIDQSMTIKCAAFIKGKQVGQTLEIPVRMNGITGKNLLRSTSVEKRLVNGVRGSLKNTDGEWATWAKNDSIALTFDAGVRKRMGNVTLGCLNDFGWAIHKPREVEVWLSDNDVHYEKVAEKRFVQDEIFREGRFVDDINLDFEGTGRYVRVILKGAGKCSEQHVRPGMEARICLDEVSIE